MDSFESTSEDAKNLQSSHILRSYETSPPPTGYGYRIKGDSERSWRKCVIFVCDEKNWQKLRKEYLEIINPDKLKLKGMLEDMKSKNAKNNPNPNNVGHRPLDEG